MAATEQIERGYLGTLLRLTLLAPALVEALLDGRAGLGAILPELLELFPETWECQHEILATRWQSRSVGFAPSGYKQVLQSSRNRRKGRCDRRMPSNFCASRGQHHAEDQA